MEEINKEKKDIKTQVKVHKKISKKKIIIISISVIVTLLFLSVIFAIINMFSEKIIPGVKIDGIDVSNLTKESITTKFKAMIEENKNKNIVLKYSEMENPITPDSIDVNYNIDKSIDKAFLVGRGKNIFANNFEIIKTFIFKQEIDSNIEISEDKLNKIIEEIAGSIPGAVQQYAYYIEDTNLIITNGKEGVGVQKDNLKNVIKQSLTKYLEKNIIINIPTTTEKPAAIDIEKIHSEIYKEAQDAYISQNPTTVHPNVNGVDFAISMDEINKILTEVKDEYTIPLKITVANKTIADLGAEAFPNELGTYSTRYDVSNTNRTNNVKLSSQKINGTIIMPGEIFSYNQTVGKRTIESGFKEAGAYANGQVIQEVGGGICQVSSTLYNAVLYANLEIVERSNHYFESSYVPAGRDATVSWGTLDFKFKNNRKYPIKITSSSKNGIETVTIYGIKEENEYEVVVQSQKTSTISRNVQYQDDSSLAKGEEVIIQNGHDGCTSEAYKILKQNGEIKSKVLLSKDTYHALERIIKRGTKAVVKPEEPTDEVLVDTNNKITNTNVQADKNVLTE